MSKSKEQKAADKARKQQLRAIAAQAAMLAIMGADSDDLVALAVQAATVAASGELSAEKALGLAESLEHTAARLREVAERGDNESDS